GPWPRPWARFPQHPVTRQTCRGTRSSGPTPRSPRPTRPTRPTCKGSAVSTPAHAKDVVVGAGMHGLSTSWHLAKELAARGLGDGADIVVLDKTGVGAGASGIACGTIRNNYFQPAMRELMAHNVSVWESDAEAFAYHPVGFLQAAPEAMHADVVQ